jgi:hypothetical protein
MKIILDTPYKEHWKSGYLVTNKENRKTVILYNNKYNRSSVSYARYQMTVFLGHYIDKSLHVDHIDNDKTNDSLLNLQLLTLKENATKQGLKIRTNKHGSLSCYRYCKCSICKQGKHLYSKGLITEYKKLINS